MGKTWQPVVFSPGDEDAPCTGCGGNYAECACIGPTEDGVEYREVDGVLQGRRRGG